MPSTPDPLPLSPEELNAIETRRQEALTALLGGRRTVAGRFLEEDVPALFALARQAPRLQSENADLRASIRLAAEIAQDDHAETAEQIEAELLRLGPEARQALETAQDPSNATQGTPASSRAIVADGDSGLEEYRAVVGADTQDGPAVRTRLKE